MHLDSFSLLGEGQDESIFCWGIEYMRKLVITTLFLMAGVTSTVFAAPVPVVNGYDTDNQGNSEIIATEQATAPKTSITTTASSNANMQIKDRVTILEKQVANLTQMTAKFNQLQSQLQNLQGQLETANHTIKVLQDQVRTQYADIDQRLSQETQATVAATKAMPTTSAATKKVATKTVATKAMGSDNTSTSDLATDNINTIAATTAAPAKKTAAKETVAAADDSTASADDADQKAYQDALDLLKTKKYPQATTAFQKFLKQYPTSNQANSARFWLGQLYLLQGQPDKALSQFKVIMKNDPNNKKAADITLQMGLAYYAKGDLTQAQSSFKKVIQKYPNTSAAKLAQSRLKLISQSDVSDAVSSSASSGKSKA